MTEVSNINSYGNYDYTKRDNELTEGEKQILRDLGFSDVQIELITESFNQTMKNIGANTIDARKNNLVAIKELIQQLKGLCENDEDFIEILKEIFSNSDIDSIEDIQTLLHQAVQAEHVKGQTDSEDEKTDLDILLEKFISNDGVITDKEDYQNLISILQKNDIPYQKKDLSGNKTVITFNYNGLDCEFNVNYTVDEDSGNVSGFKSYLDLRNYLFSGKASEAYKNKYNVNHNKSSVIELVASKHQLDYASVTEEQLLEELHKAYMEDGTPSDNRFASYEDLEKYVLGTCYADYVTLYDDNLFSGGSDAGRAVAEQHKRNYFTVSKPQVLEELHKLLVEQKESRDTMNDVGYFSSYNELVQYLQSGASYDFNRIYRDIKFTGGSQAGAVVAEYYKDNWAEVTKAEVLDDLHAQFLKLYSNRITDYHSQWGNLNYLRDYLLKDAKIDFETRHPDVKFVYGSQAGLNVYNKHKNEVSANYTREQILDELYDELKTCGDSKADFYSDKMFVGAYLRVPNASAFFESYNELRASVMQTVYNALKGSSITDFARWNGIHGLLNLVCEMHKRDYNSVSYEDVLADALNIYYQGQTSIPVKEELKNTEEIEKDPISYYDNLLNDLMQRLNSAETVSEYREIIRELSDLPLNYSALSGKYSEEYISDYSDDFGISKDVLNKLYKNSGVSSLFQKASYILAQCRANITLSDDRKMHMPFNLADYHIIIDDNGKISFDNELAILNTDGQNNGVTGMYASSYINTVCELIQERLNVLINTCQSQTHQGEVSFLINILKTLSSKADTSSIQNFLISIANEETIGNIADDDIDVNIVTDYIDRNYKDVIGDKSEFMDLVLSFYNGNNEYSYEDCAKILIKALLSYSEGEVPDREVVAKTVAQVLEMQDKDFENYKQLNETVESAITSYLEGRDNISVSEFLEFCKNNNIYASFRTEAEISQDIKTTLESLNTLLHQQIDLVNKYDGYDPPEGTSDAQKLEQIKKQIEELQYQLNKYSAETPREKAEETFKAYFLSIMKQVSNTGLTEAEVEQLLNNGTSLSLIYYDEVESGNTAGARTRGASPGVTKAVQLGTKIHNTLKNVSSSLNIVKQVSSTVGYSDGSKFVGAWSDYTASGSDLINAYKDPQKACNTIVDYLGISTNFVSAIFSYTKGDYEKGFQNGMIGFGYSLSPILGGTLQNVVNIINALNEYSKSESDYASSWQNLFDSKDVYSVAKMKLIFDISMNVLGAVGNVLTFGLLGAVQGGLKVVEQLFTSSMNKIMGQIDKWSTKLLGKPLSTLAENFWQHSGLKKLWKKTGLQKLCKILGLTSLWNKMFKQKESTSGGTVNINSDLMQTLMNLSQDMYNGFIMRGEDKVKNMYTEIDGKKVKTGEVVEHPDGSKDYYEVTENGKLVHVAREQYNIIICDDGTILHYNASSGASSDSVSTAEQGVANASNSDTDHFAQTIADIISWAQDGGNTDLAQKLREWYNGGLEGNFYWSAGSSGNTSSSSGSSGGSNGPQNGGYCPDGSWSPIADGSGFWGSVMGGVIGVGGHGGSPVLGSSNNSYHY